MPDGADVASIEALRDWLAALAIYRDGVGESLAGVQIEIRRGLGFKLQHLNWLVRSWIVRLPKLIEECYAPHGHRLQLFLEGDLARGMAVLDRRIDALERYAGLKTDYSSGPSSVPAPKPEGPR